MMMRYIKKKNTSQNKHQYHELRFNVRVVISITLTNRGKQCLFTLLIKALQLVPPVCPHAPFH